LVVWFSCPSNLQSARGTDKVKSPSFQIHPAAFKTAVRSHPKNDQQHAHDSAHHRPRDSQLAELHWRVSAAASLNSEKRIGNNCNNENKHYISDQTIDCDEQRPGPRLARVVLLPSFRNIPCLNSSGRNVPSNQQSHPNSATYGLRDLRDEDTEWNKCQKAERRVKAYSVGLGFLRTSQRVCISCMQIGAKCGRKEQAPTRCSVRVPQSRASIGWLVRGHGYLCALVKKLDRRNQVNSVLLGIILHQKKYMSTNIAA
jgi:hypothetical protein